MINPVENHIMVNAATGTCGQGDWQAIGYYKGQHVSAFGKTPVDALEKALATYNAKGEDAFE